MLYQIGPITLDTRPFNADKMSRKSAADFAAKPVIGGLKPREFMGEGDDKITLSGQLLPTKIGGLSQLETAHGFRQSGAVIPVMRGDGRSLGWFVIDGITENHTELVRNGVGFLIEYSISLTKTRPSGGAVGIIGLLLSLFGV